MFDFSLNQTGYRTSQQLGNFKKIIILSQELINTILKNQNISKVTRDCSFDRLTCNFPPFRCILIDLKVFRQIQKYS